MGVECRLYNRISNFGFMKWMFSCIRQALIIEFKKQKAKKLSAKRLWPPLAVTTGRLNTKYIAKPNLNLSKEVEVSSSSQEKSFR